MQTFLPYADFSRSAAVLDRRRLGKQRLEAKQIIQCLEGRDLPWRHHPAVKMWAGYIPLLAEYGQAICMEWRSRGYNDSLTGYFNTRIRLNAKRPPWLGLEEFHASHRSNLLRKDPLYYGAYGWQEPADLPYYWPTKQP